MDTKKLKCGICEKELTASDSHAFINFYNTYKVHMCEKCRRIVMLCLHMNHNPIDVDKIPKLFPAAEKRAD